jgi:hypothetical protein
LLVSANVSYERSAQNIVVLTGMAVSQGTQHRLVQRQPFELPIAEDSVEEISIDRGKVRIRTPKGEICKWQDYKAVNLHGDRQEAFFHANEQLVEWIKQQPLATPVICLGDGHIHPWRSKALGIWNLFSAIAPNNQRQEILDWFHLKENLYKFKATEQDLAEIETLLWQGNVETAIKQLSHWSDEQAQTFIGYLTHHHARIVNYAYFQAEGISIGSGAIESTVKQMGARIKLSGAQWKSENVPQFLLHRCAYLNGQFSN